MGSGPRAAPKNENERTAKPVIVDRYLFLISPAAIITPIAFAIQNPAITQPTSVFGVPSMLTSTIGDTVCMIMLIDRVRNVIPNNAFMSRKVGRVKKSLTQLAQSRYNWYSLRPILSFENSRSSFCIAF